MTPPFSPPRPSVGRGLLLMLAAAIATVGILSARWHGPAGVIPAGSLWQLTVAAATAVLAAAWAGPFRRAAGWLALLLVGQATTLQLSQAGPNLHYQHFAPIDRWGRLSTWILAAVLAGQAALVIRGLFLHRKRLVEAFRPFAGWRGVALLGVVVLTSATLSRAPLAYALELILAGAVAVLMCGTVVLVALSWPETPPEWWLRLERWWLTGSRSDRPGADPIAWGAVVWSTLTAAALNVLSYQRHPHIPDEIVYLLQARYFAAGKWFLQPPPVAAAFDVDLMTLEPSRWYAPVPPGWSAFLSLGVRAGLVDLVNPLLTGVAVYLAYRLIRRLYGRGTARISVLLLAASPWLLFMGMSYMTHQLALVCALGAALAVSRWRDGGRAGWLLPGGIGIGLVSLNRPLEGLALALLLGLWVLATPARSWLWRAIGGGMLAGATALTAAVTLPYNAFFTGNPWYFPVMAYTDRLYGKGSNALGFGPNRGLGWTGLDPFPGHNLRDALINANLNTFMVNVDLLGWATGSLVVLAALVVGLRKRREDWWMIAVGVVVVGLHSLYYFSGGPDLGARYWYLLSVPAVILTARGLEELACLPGIGADGSRRVAGAGLALVLGAVLVFLPWRAVDKYYHYRGMRPDLRTLVHDPRFADALVLVQGNRHTDWASAVVYDPLDLAGAEPVFAWDRSAEVRQEVLRAFPDRSVWLVAGPSVTGGRYRVIEGPLTPDAAGRLPWPTVDTTAMLGHGPG